MRIVAILAAVTIVVIGHIKASEDVIWKEITNYSHIHRLDKDVVRSSSKKIGPNRHVLDMKVDKKVVELSYQVEVTEDAPRELRWRTLSGDIKVNKGFIKLIPTKGGTKLVYHREIEGVKGIPDGFLKPVCRISMNRVIQRLKERTERESKGALEPK